MGEGARHLIHWEVVSITNNQRQDETFLADTHTDEAKQQALRQAVRENTRRVLADSGLAEMLKTLNKNALKGRGTFQEFDALIVFRWGTAYTRRHLWIEIEGNRVRFRMHPHLQCSGSAPICDGEYHTFTSAMWANRAFLLDELHKYYLKPVAETSSD